MDAHVGDAAPGLNSRNSGSEVRAPGPRPRSCQQPGPARKGTRRPASPGTDRPQSRARPSYGQIPRRSHPRGLLGAPAPLSLCLPPPWADTLLCRARRLGHTLLLAQNLPSAAQSPQAESSRPRVLAMEPQVLPTAAWAHQTQGPSVDQGAGGLPGSVTPCSALGPPAVPGWGAGVVHGVSFAVKTSQLSPKVPQWGGSRRRLTPGWPRQSESL